MDKYVTPKAAISPCETLPINLFARPTDLVSLAVSTVKSAPTAELGDAGAVRKAEASCAGLLSTGDSTNFRVTIQPGTR